MTEKPNKRQKLALERREKIRRYRIRGLAISEIAKLLDIAPRTVKWHLQKLKKRMIRSAEDIDPHLLLTEFNDTRREIMRELWRLYYNAETHKERVGVMKIIKECNKELAWLCIKSDLLSDISEADEKENEEGSA